MKNLKVGDKIIDLVMSKHHGKLVTPTIIEINKIKGITKRIICFDSKFPNNYPYAFYDFEKDIRWTSGEFRWT